MNYVSATVTSVDDSNTVQTLLEANGRRHSVTVFNDSTAVLYVKLGSAASTTDFSFKLGAGSYWEMPNGYGYQGIITGVWASNASGAAKITELTR